MKQYSEQQLTHLSMVMRQYNFLRSELDLPRIPEPGLDYLVKYFRQPGYFSPAWDNVWLHGPLLWEVNQFHIKELEARRFHYWEHTSRCFNEMVGRASAFKRTGQREELKAFELKIREERLESLKELFRITNSQMPEEWINLYERNVRYGNWSIVRFFKVLMGDIKA